MKSLKNVGLYVLAAVLLAAMFAFYIESCKFAHDGLRECKSMLRVVIEAMWSKLP